MPNEVATAIIAFTGVVVSVLISYLVSIRQTNIEFQKLRTEIQKEFGGKLFEKRLRVYPDLYAYLSTFGKVIHFSEISKAAVCELVSKWQEWDSKYSILFGRSTGQISYDLRVKFIKMAEKSDEELQEEFGSAESRKTLRYELAKLELALKNELGVFTFESPLSLKEVGLLTSYTEATVSTEGTRLASRPKNKSHT